MSSLVWETSAVIYIFAIVQSTVSDLLKDSNPLGLEWKSPGSSSSLKYCRRRGLNAVPWHRHMERCLATDFIQVQALHWTYLILLVYKKLFFELSSCHETSDEILFGFELKNPTIYNIIRWFPGTNDSSTKHLMFQVLFIFHNFLQNSLQKSFQFNFLFF